MPWNVLATGTLRTLTDATLNIAFPNGIPQFFMTGDGHRNPPFAWTMNSAPQLKIHFLNQLASGKLCVHVEQHQEDIDEESVPGQLQPLYHQQRIFGWELPLYRDLQPLMEQSMMLTGDVLSLPPAEIAGAVKEFDRLLVRMHALLHQIGNPHGLRNAMTQHEQYQNYYVGITKGGRRDHQIEQQYVQFLMAYHNTAMDLRTTVNNYIGARINARINLHPTCTHLITCGDAHILQNDLSQYVLIPATAHGVVDAANR